MRSAGPGTLAALEYVSCSLGPGAASRAPPEMEYRQRGYPRCLSGSESWDDTYRRGQKAKPAVLTPRPSGDKGMIL